MDLDLGLKKCGSNADLDPKPWFNPSILSGI